MNNAAAAQRFDDRSRFGRRAEPVTSPYERILLDEGSQRGGLGPALARASQRARRRLAAEYPPDPALDRVACGAGAPLALGFVLWSLHRAEVRGLERLLFPSREGVVLADMATVLAGALGIPVECRAIPASRPSWSLASIDEAGLDVTLPLLVDRGAAFSVDDVLHRFGVDPASFAGTATAEVTSSLPDDHRALIDVDARAAILRALAVDPRFRAALVRRAAEERRRLRAWFAQEGLLDGTPSALVDAGTGSTLYTALRSALAGEEHGCGAGLYLGLRRDAVIEPWGAPDTFLFDATRNRSPRRPPGLVPFIEAVCAGRTGRLAGYDVDPTGKVVPRYSPAENTVVLAWGIERVHRGLRLVTEELAAALPRDPFTDLRRAITRLLTSFWLHPQLDEARRWSSFPWEVGWAAAAGWEPLAMPFSVRRLRDGVRAGIRPGPPYWIGASLALRAPTLYAMIDSASRLASGRRHAGALIPVPAGALDLAGRTAGPSTADLLRSEPLAVRLGGTGGGRT